MKKTEMHFPHTMEELVESLAQMKEGDRLLAGGTDLIIALNEGTVEPERIVDITGVTGLRTVEETEGFLELGAAVTFTELEEHPLVQPYRALAYACSDVGSKQIRNKGTLAGSIANCSPAGDLLPVLIAYQAKVRTINGRGEEAVWDAEKIAAGPGRTNLAVDEAITKIQIPRNTAQTHTAFQKLGGRRAVTIAKINAAVKGEIDASGRLSQVRIALGAVGRTAFRARKAEALLEGSCIEQWSGERLGKCLAEEIKSSIPGRPSVRYKQEAVYGLAQDLWSRFLE